MKTRTHSGITAQLIALIAIPTLMGQAQADVIVIADPTTQVTSSSVIIGCCTDRIDDRIVNGSGLSGGLHDVNPSNMWLSAANGFGGIDPDPSMTFDLGAE